MRSKTLNIVIAPNVLVAGSRILCDTNTWGCTGPNIKWCSFHTTYAHSLLYLKSFVGYLHCLIEELTYHFICMDSAQYAVCDKLKLCLLEPSGIFQYNFQSHLAESVDVEPAYVQSQLQSLSPFAFQFPHQKGSSTSIYSLEPSC